jgi:sorting nexin-9/18/33
MREEPQADIWVLHLLCIVQLDVTHNKEVSESESSSTTPRATLHPTPSQVSLPSIMPQHTGEWLRFPSFPQSLLGGKSLNRFSNFVTSGAEAFVLNGSPASAASGSTHSKEDTTTVSRLETVDEERNKLSLLGESEVDKHFIDTGPAGPVWRAKTPTFDVLVHSPSKRTPPLSAPYTMYSVTSLFSTPNPEPASDWVQVPDPDDSHSPPSSSCTGPDGGTVTRMTVQRRFSHFVMLHTVLSRRLPGIALPPLPEKQYAGRFSSDFIEARRGDLERYLNKIVRHPIVRYAEILTVFLSCENEDVSAPLPSPTWSTESTHPVTMRNGPASLLNISRFPL